MNAPICTLFEGAYHLGVGALANSAYRNGWRGILYAGYRGDLPAWAASARRADRGSILEFAPEASIHFIPLNTTAHLTNYKPDFMLDVWNTLLPNAGSMFYFDPDIVLHGAWAFFEEWVSYGLALCEDVNSPLSFNHPRRAAWKRYFREHGLQLGDVTAMYVNGGFAGLSKEYKSFLRVWAELQKAMAVDLGGLAAANLGDNQALAEEKQPPTYMFNRTDQDALNAAVMASGCPVSIMGKEGMDFKPGGYLMSHALGRSKPWQMNYLASALNGIRPRPADKYYWDSVETPIRLYSHSFIAAKKAQITLAAFIGRFYHRA